MIKATCLTLAVLAITVICGANIATALDPIPVESGFSGFVRPGVGYMRYKSNMVARVPEKSQALFFTFF